MKNVDKLGGTKEKPCTISGVSESALRDKIKDILKDIEKMDLEGEWYDFMYDAKNAELITKLGNYCR
jgi:hypothetical protein